MKLENLVFQKKAKNYAHVNLSYPNVKVTGVRTAGHRSGVRISFRMCASLYGNNTYCVYAIAGNRLYFMFSSESWDGYKLQIASSSKKSKSKPYNPTKSFVISGNNEVSKFISAKEYTPKLDNECGLWYIEY